MSKAMTAIGSAFLNVETGYCLRRSSPKVNVQNSAADVVQGIIIAKNSVDKVAGCGRLRHTQCARTALSDLMKYAYNLPYIPEDLNVIVKAKNLTSYIYHT